jgi:hypothetical protein
MIEVIDPTHPLCGRRFHVLRLFRAARGEGFAEVRYREDLRLRIPLNSTDRSAAPVGHSRTKLTLEVIQQLIALVKEYRNSCRSHPISSGPDSPKP